MIHALTEQLSTALAAFSSTTRLYELTIADAQSSLLVEAFVAQDAVDEVGVREVIALSTHAYVDPASLLGQAASLAISLADGSRSSFAGEISEAAMLGSDGGFARYRIRIAPWLWRLDQVRNSRVCKEKWRVNENVLCDPEQSNTGWDIRDDANKNKTLLQLRAREGAAPKYTGRCYAEHIKNHQ